MRRYRSSIPKAARERVVATFVTGPQKYKAEYRLNGKAVGVRYFEDTGDLAYEIPLKNGVTHGIVYYFDESGSPYWAEPYRNGLPHGTSKQWSRDGKLLGTYAMKHGTGLDLWWHEGHYGTGSPTCRKCVT